MPEIMHEIEVRRAEGPWIPNRYGRTLLIAL